MLVLSRKIGEEIVVGKGVRIRTLQIRGNRVRLGIIAPDNVPVHRHEVHRQIIAGIKTPIHRRKQDS